tara:strand:- start:47 stop:451 length:405 start_codon:yes stop_codon:yes gene_type:complete
MNQFKINFLEKKLVQYIGSPIALPSIMKHLIGTAEILKSYNAPNYLVDAGLFHSIYGEESSRNMPKNLYLTRDELVGIIGHKSEKIVYEFCSIPNPRLDNIILYPDGQLKNDLILLDKANEEQMNLKRRSIGEK